MSDDLHARVRDTLLRSDLQGDLDEVANDVLEAIATAMEEHGNFAGIGAQNDPRVRAVFVEWIRDSRSDRWVCGDCGGDGFGFHACESSRTDGSRVKQWPKKGHVDFVDLVSPVKAILEDVYRNGAATRYGFAYDGYDIGSREKACNSSPDWQFSAEGIEHHRRQGRSILDIALMVTFQLGVEQGRRLTMEDPLVRVMELESKAFRELDVRKPKKPDRRTGGDRRATKRRLDDKSKPRSKRPTGG